MEKKSSSRTIKRALSIRSIRSEASPTEKKEACSEKKIKETKKKMRINNLTSQLRITAQIINEYKEKQFEYLTKAHFSKYTLKLIGVFAYLIIIQMSLFFSQDVSGLYEKTLTFDEKQTTTILSGKSVFGGFLGFLGSLEFCRTLKPELLLMILLAIVLGLMFIIFAFWKINWVKSIYLTYLSNSGKVKVNYYSLQLLTFLFNNYELILFVLSYIGLNGFFCRWILVPKVLGSDEDLQESSIKSDYLKWIEGGIVEMTEPLQVSMLSDDIVCHSNMDLGFKIISGFLCVCLLVLRMIFNRIWNFSPSIGILQSKYGNKDLLIDLSMVLGIIMRAFITNMDSFDNARLLVFSYFCLNVVIFVTISVSSPYYNNRYQTLKNLQVLMLVFGSGLYLMASSGFFKETLFKREFNTICLLLISMTILVRLNSNIRGSDKAIPIIKKLRRGKLKFLSEKELLCVVYSIKKYLGSLVEAYERGEEICQEGKRIQLLVHCLNEWHQKECLTTKCFCKKNLVEVETPIRDALNNPIFKNDTFALKGLLLCDALLKDHLTKKSSEAILISYIEFLGDYLGKVPKGIMLLKRNESQMTGTLKYELLKDRFDKLAKINLDTSAVALAVYHNLIHHNHKMALRIQIKTPVLFLNSVELLKEFIMKLTDAKEMFLMELSEGVNYKKIFKKVMIISDLKYEISRLSTSLIYKSKALYPGLLNLMHKFTLNILQDIKTGENIFKLYKRATIRNLNKIFYTPRYCQSIKSYDFGVLYVGGETSDFHQIKYVSSNIRDNLGWQKSSLLNQDLNLILPASFSSLHRHFIYPEKLKGTMITKRTHRNLVCLDNKGDLKPVSIAVRINESVFSRGIEYVGVMNFKVENKIFNDQYCVLILNEAGIIKDMSRNAEEFFGHGDKAVSYFEELRQVFKNFDIILKERKKNTFRDDRKYFKMLEDKKLLHAWKDYSRWTSGAEIEFEDKNNKTFLAKMKIDDYSRSSYKIKIRYLIFSSIGKKKYHNFSLRMKEDQEEHEKRIIKIASLATTQKLSTISSNKPTDFNDSSEKNPFEKNMMVGNKNVTKIHTFSDKKEQFPFMTDRVYNTEGRQKFLNKEEERPMRPNEDKKYAMTEAKSDIHSEVSFKAKMNGANGLRTSEVISGYCGEDYKGDGQFGNYVEEEVEFSSRNDSMSMNFAPVLKNFRKGNKRSSLNKANTTSFAVSSIIHHNKATNLSENMFKSLSSNACSSLITSSKLRLTTSERSNEIKDFEIGKGDISKNARPHFITKISFTLVMLILFVNFYPIMVKLPIQEKTTTEIPAMLINFDIVGWILWAQLYAIISVEGNRAVREGWVDNEYVRPIIKNQTYWDYAYAASLSSETYTFMWDAELAYDMKMRDIQFMDLFTGYGEMVVDYAQVEFYSVAGRPITQIEGEGVKLEENAGLIKIDNKTTWYNRSISRRTGLKLTGLVGEAYSRRNYSSDGDDVIPPLGPDRDRNNDPFEDMYRRLLIGDLLKKASYLSYDSGDYVKAVAIQNEKYIFFTFIFGSVSCCGLVFGFSVYYCFQIKKMKEFYAQIFVMKECDLKKAISQYKHSSKELRFLVEEDMELVVKNRRKLKTITSSFRLKAFAFKKKGFAAPKTPQTPNPGQSIINVKTKNPFSLKQSRDKSILSKASKTGKKKSKRRDNRIKQSEETGFTFGFSSLILKLLVVSAMFVLLQLSIYLMLAPKAKRITNLSTVYVLSIESWNAFWVLQVAAVETILYNNTVTMFGGVKSLDLYYEFRSFCQSYILDNYTRGLDYDLGSFTDQYRNTLTKGNSCLTHYQATPEDSANNPMCYKYYEGLVNSNLMNAFKGVITTTDLFITEWEQKRHSWDEVNSIYKRWSFLAIITNLRRIWIVTYYWASKEPANIANKQVVDDLEFAKTSTYLFGFIVIIAGFTLYYSLVKAVQRKMIYFYNTLGIIPLMLVEKNVGFLFRLMKVRKGRGIF